jgi:SRSO17 transposase
MGYQFDTKAEQRLETFFGEVGSILNNKCRREAFAAYGLGLLSDLDRKSTEPIAAMSYPDLDGADAAHQRLLHFAGQAQWSDEAVRAHASRHAVGAMTEHEAVEAWIVDDTGFLKQGKHSVGVQRQYTGSAGKVANCQIGVSLSLATRTMHVPVDFDLYLPRLWADDPERRDEAKIPDEVEFKTKPELGLQMVDRALAAELPTGIALADAAYGNSSEFRSGLRSRGLRYGVDVESRTKVWRVDSRGRKNGKPLSIRKQVKRLGIRNFRKVTWREGTKGEMWSWFAKCRVIPWRENRATTKPEVVWLLVEWPPNETSPTKFTLVTLPKSTSTKQLVRVTRQRWRTERMYQDMKGELGLDHFEGRRFRGWHHHVTVALCCYAFVAAEQARSFSPSTGGRTGHSPQRHAS